VHDGVAAKRLEPRIWPQPCADGTLYADGAHFEQDNAMIAHIISLMQCGVEVGIVTAAGYPGEAHKVRMLIQ